MATVPENYEDRLIDLVPEEFANLRLKAFEQKARERCEQAMSNAKAKVAEMDDEDLLGLIVDGPIMGGAPRLAIFGAINDHTAHHRGALTVYARLNGVVPAMPYMDMSGSYFFQIAPTPSSHSFLFSAGMS